MQQGSILGCCRMGQLIGSIQEDGTAHRQHPGLVQNSQEQEGTLTLCCCSVAQSCLTATPRTAARQAFLSITLSRSLLKLMSTESLMPSSHLVLCRPLLLLLSLFPSIRVFFSESVPHIRWPRYWSFRVSPSSEYSGALERGVGGWARAGASCQLGFHQECRSNWLGRWVSISERALTWRNQPSPRAGLSKGEFFQLELKALDRSPILSPP